MNRCFWRVSMVALLIVVPVTLALVLRERQSWRPRVLEYPTGFHGPLLFSPDGNLLACASPYGASDSETIIVLFDCPRGSLKGSLTVPEWSVDSPRLSSLGFSQDSRVLYLSDAPFGTNARWRFAAWCLASQELTSQTSRDCGYAIVSPVGGMVAINPSYQIQLRDILSWKLLRICAQYRNPGYMAFSQGGDKLAVVLNDLKTDGAVAIFDVARGKMIGQRRPLDKSPLSDLEAFAISSNNQYVAVGDFRRIGVWDLASGKALWTITSPGSYGQLAFSPDCKTLVGGGDEETRCHIWDSRNGRQLQSIELGSALTAVAFSADGTLLGIAEENRVTLHRMK